MIVTEDQRRWWFATHPEFSSSRRRTRGDRHGREKEATGKVRPEDVDAYVDEALKYETGPVAELLKSIKRNFGTQGESQKDGHSQDSPKKIMLAGPMYTPHDWGFWGPPLGGGGASVGARSPAGGGIRSLPSAPRPLPSGAAGATRLTRNLGRNMEKAGRPRPPNHAAHHIVPEKDSRFPEAVETRKILEKFNISLYDPHNGVWLPNKHGAGDGAYHPAVHTRRYYRHAERLLRRAQTGEGAVKTLRNIGRRLSAGLFPR